MYFGDRVELALLSWEIVQGQMPWSEWFEQLQIEMESQRQNHLLSASFLLNWLRATYPAMYKAFCIRAAGMAGGRVTEEVKVRESVLMPKIDISSLSEIWKAKLTYLLQAISAQA